MENKVFDFKYNRFNPSVTEWPDSIYSFNKYTLNTSLTSKITFNILNNYFNTKLFKSFVKKKIIKEKFSTLKRVFVSIPEIKTSLNKIDIFVYVFNKEKFIIDKKLNKLIKITRINKERKIKKINNFKKLSIIIDLYNYKNNWLRIFNNLIAKHLSNNIEIISKYLKKKISKPLYVNNFIIKKTFMKRMLYHMNMLLYKKYCSLFLYKYYISERYFNKLKFNSINLFHLKKIFYEIYNKDININIINLKYLYLDNSIFVDAIIRKLRQRRRKVLRVLRKALILPKIPTIDPMFLLKRKEQVSFFIYKIFDYSKINIIKSVFMSLKNIHVTGIRLEGNGRLTRRLTASRAVHKKAYKGSLKNIYSSYKGYSVLNTKGFNRSSLNYINLNSNTRNGSYGIKGWQNTM